MPYGCGVPTFRIVTANVNGIRAAARRGGLDWLADAKPDVVCLQEVRATHEQLHEVLADSPVSGFHVSHAPAPQLGRAGVAVLTRDQPDAVRTTTRQAGIDGQGRWIEVDIPSPVGDLTVASVYVHTGEVDTRKQVDKYEFLAGMDKRLSTLRTKSRRDGRQVVVCGDFNVARAEIDIKNWKGNRGKAGFLEDERDYLDRWFAKDWVDLGRVHGGEGPGPYTWWSWRGRGFDTDGGWRIDYVVVSPGLAKSCIDVTVGKAATYDSRWSDHAPVTADFKSGR